jgi:hypothetical protein
MNLVNLCVLVVGEFQASKIVDGARLVSLFGRAAGEAVCGVLSGPDRLLCPRVRPAVAHRKKNPTTTRFANRFLFMHIPLLSVSFHSSQSGRSDLRVSVCVPSLELTSNASSTGWMSALHGRPSCARRSALADRSLGLDEAAGAGKRERACISVPIEEPCRRQSWFVSAVIGLQTLAGIFRNAPSPEGLFGRWLSEERII